MKPNTPFKLKENSPWNVFDKDGKFQFEVIDGELAAEVVSRVNGYDGLLAACKAAIEVLPGLEVRSWPPGHAIKRDAIKLLEAAIAAAEVQHE